MTEAEIKAALEELDQECGLVPPKPKPKTVADRGQIVRDADVHVSPKDPNYRTSIDGMVAVRRPLKNRPQ